MPQAAALERAASPTLEDLAARLAAVEAALAGPPAAPAAAPAPDKLSLVLYSGELDKVLAALTIATGAANLGTEVTIFFTFWATPALRRGSLHSKRP
jgi:hypothetical protein